MTTTIWLILLSVALVVMATIMLIDHLHCADRVIKAARADVARPDRVTYVFDTSAWDLAIDQALAIAESTPDLRRIK